MDLQTYLTQATQDEWHQIAWNWNWDSGFAPLQWIIRQPICDRGTALLVYWYNGPRYLAQYAMRSEAPKRLLDQYDLLLEIEQAYLAGKYTCAEIAFDPHDDEGHDWTEEYANLPFRRPIPQLLYIASPGHKAARRHDFHEGYPPAVEWDT